MEWARSKEKPETNTPPRQRAKGADLWSLGLLPVLFGGSALGLIGVYWDIAWHIDIGRDTFFTLPHNFLYTNILIVLLVSAYGLWRDRRETPFHLPLGRLRLHTGLLMVAIAAALELAFAPLDELWHRLFGADVALWAPMHLVGLLALGVAIFGGLVTSWIERNLAEGPRRRSLFVRVALAYSALLLAWTMLLLAEYEYSVIQFPMVFHPILLAALPSFTLVLVARLQLGSFGATWSALLFTLLRLAIAGMLMLTASLELAGQSRPMIPLLLISALIVDLLARRKFAAWQLGVVAGAATLALNSVMVWLGNGLEWHAETLIVSVVPALLLSAVMGGAAGWVAASLRGEPAKTEFAAKPSRRPA